MQGLRINNNRVIPRARLLREEHSRFKQVFFLIWPAATFIYSLFSMRSPSSRFVIILFYGLCGFFYPFSFSDNVDVVRHAQRFQEVAQQPFSDFFDTLFTLYVNDTNKPDILQPFLDFLISRITDDYRIYFAVLGLLLGYLLMKLVEIVYADSKEKQTGLFVLMLFLFLLVLLPPYRIAGFRQIIATVLFCIGCYKVLVHKNNIYHLVVLATPLVHFGFLSLLPFYVLYFVVGKKHWIYFILIILAFSFRDQATTLIGEAGSDLQGQFGARVRGYSSDRYMEDTVKVTQGQLSIIKNQMPFTAYFLFGLLLIFKVQGKFKFAEKDNSLYSMLLCVFVYIAFISQLHNTLVRFSLIFVLLSAILIVRLTYTNQIRSIGVKLALLVVVSINTVVMLRKASEFTGAQVLVPNIVVQFFMETDSSVWDLVRTVF